MTTAQFAKMTAAPSRRWALNAYRVVSYSIPLLILIQALLAGEWLAGHDLIRVHEWNGVLLVALALLQVGIVLVAGLKARMRTAVLGVTALIFVLMTVQLGLGLSGFDAANQARALHLPMGLLIFGLSGGNVSLARRAGQRD